MKPVYCPGPNSPLTWIPNRGSRSQGGARTHRTTTVRGIYHMVRSAIFRTSISGTHHCQGNSHVYSGAPSKSGTKTEHHMAYHTKDNTYKCRLLCKSCLTSHNRPPNSGSGPQRPDFVYNNSSITAFPYTASRILRFTSIGCCGIKNHQATINHARI